jgi:hemerythrin-like domain-containing protein
MLDLLEMQVGAYHRGEHPNYDLMADVVAYLQNYADVVHHPREEVAFDLLLKRAPETRPVIERLRQDHRVIVNAGDALYRRLDEAINDVLVPRSELESAAAAFLLHYRNHLRTEERELIPKISHALRPADWAAVKSAVPAISDPVFGESAQDRFRLLRARIDSEAELPALD